MFKATIEKNPGGLGYWHYRECRPFACMSILDQEFGLYDSKTATVEVSKRPLKNGRCYTLGLPKFLDYKHHGVDCESDILLFQVSPTWWRFIPRGALMLLRDANLAPTIKPIKLYVRITPKIQ